MQSGAEEGHAVTPPPSIGDVKMAEVTLRGACLCGSVKFEVKGEPSRFLHCHCARCRKITGTGHATNFFLQPGSLAWTGGEEHVRAYKLPEAERFGNQFCTQCGSRLPRQAPGSNMVLIPAGSLDDDIPMAPRARIFWDSRAPWSCEGDALPVFARYPT